MPGPARSAFLSITSVLICFSLRAELAADAPMEECDFHWSPGLGNSAVTSGTVGCAMGREFRSGKRVKGTQQSALSNQHSAISTQHSAFSRLRLLQLRHFIRR